MTIVLPDGEVYGASDAREADVDSQVIIKESTGHIVPYEQKSNLTYRIGITGHPEAQPAPLCGGSGAGGFVGPLSERCGCLHTQQATGCFNL